ncbi:hypothetical protein [Neobacillus sp. PS2-9]|uniref:hypothetical protein n=1 Tax=Neobacillus sp. PS2-9 TaxID=3070676 RepID=UPI0027DF73F9|nr:hypothetical protein [Neobacillus sp. PS2-9]WML58807.1 hypothetical protein RCG25_03140 [Neobacillus sp. PS2-9]
MKAKRTAAIVAIGLLCLAITVIINLLHKDVWDQNEDLLKEEVLSLGASVETVNLREITPFKWDVAYSFPPYTPKEDIYKTVGYKWDRVSETVNEGMDQIVFMKDGKVVCYIYGYPENKGYGLSIQTDQYKGAASFLRAEDGLIFKVKRSNGIVYLSN